MIPINSNPTICTFGLHSLFYRLAIQFYLCIVLMLILVPKSAASTPQISPDAKMAIASSMADQLPGDYQIIENDQSCCGRNPRQGLSMMYQNQWVRFSDQTDTWHWCIALNAMGRDSLTVLPSPKLSVQGSILKLQRGPLVTEWYRNTIFGWEQGFTLHRRPAGQTNATLQLVLTTAGELTPEVIDDHHLALKDALGIERLKYGGLYVYDADGQELAARLMTDENRLIITVNDSDATYPITVDPWVEMGKLSASDAAGNDQFGIAVAIDGDLIAVGAHYNYVDPYEKQGSVYLFQKPVNGWNTMAAETVRLQSTDAGANHLFGKSVAISGDHVIVGATDYNNNEGAAYVFEKGAGWTNGSGNQVAKLVSGDTAALKFGLSVDISGDTAVVGAYTTPNYRGAAYVFEKSAGSNNAAWEDSTDDQTAKLTASDAADVDLFGFSVAVDGTTIVVGAYAADISSVTDQGAAYVFENSGSAWSESAKLYAGDGANSDYFGYSVAISGDVIVAGANYADISGVTDQGAAYVFEKSAGSNNAAWENGANDQTAKLTASDGVSKNYLGMVLDIDGDRIIAGVPKKDINGNGSQGSVYVFEKPSAGWSSMYETYQLTTGGDAPYEEIGCSVRIDGDVLVAGAVRTNNTYVGTAYVFQHFVSGDFNANGAVDLEDAIIVLLILTGQDPGDFNILADVDGDGKITAADLVFILEKLAQLR